MAAPILGLVLSIATSTAKSQVKAFAQDVVGVFDQALGGISLKGIVGGGIAQTGTRAVSSNLTAAVTSTLMKAAPRLGEIGIKEAGIEGGREFAMGLVPQFAAAGGRLTDEQVLAITNVGRQRAEWEQAAINQVYKISPDLPETASRLGISAALGIGSLKESVKNNVQSIAFDLIRESIREPLSREVERMYNSDRSPGPRQR